MPDVKGSLQKFEAEYVAGSATDPAVVCIDLKTASSFLGYAPQRIFALTKAKDYCYREIQIPKKNNSGFRTLSIPSAELKGVQRSIYYQILGRIKCSPYAWAYIPGRSSVSAARIVAGHRAQLKVDITDFFPSISANRVFGLFRSLGFNAGVAGILTDLTVHNGRLAQGAPTSPAISNLICRQMDRQLSAFAEKWNVTYLRYSDDMIFASSKNFNHTAFYSTVSRIVRDNGFGLNSRKTEYTALKRPRRALGLLVDGRLRMPRKKAREIRSAFFKASSNFRWAEGNMDRLLGNAEYYKSIFGSNPTYRNYKRILNNVKALKLHEPYKAS